jgi:hypothetical protein
MKQDINNKLIRCPRLGDEIPFSYCLQEAGELPCLRIVSCWMIIFDVENFLKENLEPKKWEKVINFQPKNKITSLIEFIEAAKAKK